MMLPDDADTSTTIADIMRVQTSSSSTGSQPSTRPGKVIKKRPAVPAAATAALPVLPVFGKSV